MTEAIEEFHRHLDRCWQCREHPFALCAVGAPLLEAAGKQAMEELAGSVTGNAVGSDPKDCRIVPCPASQFQQRAHT